MTKSNRVAVNRPPNYSNGFAPRDGQPLYPELWRGCVGAWNPGLGPSGLVLRDWSGLGNHGTLTNMDPGADWVTSQGRYALDFDGSNDFVESHSDVLLTGNPAFSLTAWIYVSSSLSSIAALFGWGNTNVAGSACGPWYGIHVANGLSLEFAGGNPVYSLATLTRNTWHHIVFTKTPGAINTTTRIFYSGRETAIAFGTSSIPNIESSKLAIGRWSNFASNNFFGQLADIRMYNRAISANEIQLLATRPSIAYELAPRRRSSVQVVGGFKAAWIPRRSLVIGGGTN